MSLINDALRRASQTERNRPQRAPSHAAMEPVPVVRGSRLSLLLVVTMFASLLLACWCFWQWWVVRSDNAVTHVVNVATPPPTIPIAPPPVQAPAPAPKPAAAAPALKPVVVASVAPVAPPKPAPKPAPVPASAPLAAVPAKPAPVPPPAAATPLVAPRGAAPPEVPLVSNFSPTPWPVDLKLNAIFFSKTNPRALINGNVYSPGDDIQGVLLKKIENDKVTLEWSGHTRVLNLQSQ